MCVVVVSDLSLCFSLTAASALFFLLILTLTFAAAAGAVVVRSLQLITDAAL